MNSEFKASMKVINIRKNSLKHLPKLNNHSETFVKGPETWTEGFL